MIGALGMKDGTPRKVKPSPLVVHVDLDDLNLNKTHLQKYLAGAYLFGLERGDRAGFIRDVRDRGIKRIELVGDVSVGMFEGVEGVKRVEVVENVI